MQSGHPFYVVLYSYDTAAPVPHLFLQISVTGACLWYFLGAPRMAGLVLPSPCVLIIIVACFGTDCAASLLAVAFCVRRHRLFAPVPGRCRADVHPINSLRLSHVFVTEYITHAPMGPVLPAGTVARRSGRDVLVAVLHPLSNTSCRLAVATSVLHGLMAAVTLVADSWTCGQGGRCGCPSVAFHMLPHLGMPPLQPEHHACVCSSLSSALASVLVPAPHTSGRGRAVRDAQHLNPPLGSPVTGVGH